MDNLLDSTTEPQKSVLLVGASGQMKTICSSLFPEPQLWLAGDPGQRSGLTPVWDKLTKNPDNMVIKVRKTPYKDILNYMLKEKRFKTIIYDSITFIQHCFLSELMQKTAKTKPTYDEWGFVLEWSRNLIHAGLESDSHVVITCLEQLVKEDLTGRVSGLPLVFGKFAHDLPAMVRTALHVEARPKQKEQPERTVRSVPDHIWGWCKDSEGILDPIEKHPDWVVKFLYKEDEKPKPEKEKVL